MKYCTNCGSEFRDEATFCSHCGAKKETDVQSAPASEVNAAYVKEKLTKTFSQTKNSIQKSGYFNYLKATAKNPSALMNGGLSNNEYGWIQFAALTAVTAMALYFGIIGTAKIAFSEIGMGLFSSIGNSLITEAIQSVIPRLVIMGLTFYAIFAGSAFVILKFLTRGTGSFSTMLNQFGGLLTPNILLLLFSAILSMLIPTENTLVLSFLLIGFALLLCFIAFNYFLYSMSIQNKIDTFYVLLISNIVLFVVIALVVYLQIEPLISAIEEISNMPYGYGW